MDVFGTLGNLNYKVNNINILPHQPKNTYNSTVVQKPLDAYT